jgi:hypothetical protein
MLTSDKRSEVDMAIVLLDGLATGEAVDGQVSNQVRALIQSTYQAGIRPDATDEQRAQAAAIISYADRPRVDVIQAPDKAPPPEGAPSSLVSAAIDTPALPIRVYFQIGGESDRAAATAAAATLRDAGLVVPGIELVGSRRTPQRDSVRYCAEKVTPEALERVRAATAQLKSAPGFVVLDPKLCGRVRFNHFELWFAQTTS